MIVDKVLSLSDRQRLIVHIHSFDWEFSNYGPVVLQFGDASVHCRYVASGVEHDQPVLELIPQDSCRYTVETISQMITEFGGTDGEQLKQDVRDGRIDPERLVDLIIAQERQLARAQRRIKELEEQVGSRPTERLDQPFSIKAEEKRRAARGKRRKKKTQAAPQRAAVHGRQTGAGGAGRERVSRRARSWAVPVFAQQAGVAF